MNSYAMAVVGANQAQIDVHPLDQPGQGLVADLVNGDDFEN